MSYTSVTVSGYNSSPPPDDGSTGSDNQVTWAKIKTKIGDPVKTAVESVNTNVASAFTASDAAWAAADAVIAGNLASLSASYTASDVLTKIKTVDGTGSGLDADTVDGVEAAALLKVASNLSDIASASTAFSNIKQDASTSATGVVELATDAETVTGTDTGRVSPVSSMVRHEGVAKAWGAIANSGSASISDSYNITSVSRTGQGVVRVTMSVTMANSSYSVVATPFNASHAAIVRVIAKTTTTFDIFTEEDDGADADMAFSFVVFGTLA